MLILFNTKDAMGCSRQDMDKSMRHTRSWVCDNDQGQVFARKVKSAMLCEADKDSLLKELFRTKSPARSVQEVIP